MARGKANVSEDKYDAQYCGIIHEQGTEVFDHDLNLLQDFNRKEFEYLMQTMFGDGYIAAEPNSMKIKQATSTTQNFAITLGNYFVDGKKYALAADVDYDDQTYGYPVITITGVSTTTLTFAHKVFVASPITGADLIGCRVQILTGAYTGTYNILSNTATSITCAENFTTGGVLTTDTCKILPPALTASGSGTRTDEVYLDCFEEEVNDYEDTAIRDTAFGFSSSHRYRNSFCVRVAEDGTTPSSTPEHTFVKIATLSRAESATTIVTADITADDRTQCELSTNVYVPIVHWTLVTDATATLEWDKKYVANRGTLITMTLPAITSADIGKEIEITGMGTGGWRVSQLNGQIIYMGTATTTTGASGYVASTHQRDSIKLVALSTTTMNIASSIGNITIL